MGSGVSSEVWPTDNGLTDKRAGRFLSVMVISVRMSGRLSDFQNTPQVGIEPTTSRLEVSRAIQLRHQGMTVG